MLKQRRTLPAFTSLEQKLRWRDLSRLQAPTSSMSIISMRVTQAEQLPWVLPCGVSETSPHLPPPTLTIQADVFLDGDAQVTMPTFLWVAPGKVLGGNVGFGAIVPYGRKAFDLDVDALATLPFHS